MVTSNQLDKPLHPDRVDPSRFVQVSWQPRVFVYKVLLSEEERSHLVLLANDQGGKNIGSNEHMRNAAQQRRLFDFRELSDTTAFKFRFLPQEELVGRIEERISAVDISSKSRLQLLDAESEDAKHGYGYNDNTSSSTLNETVATVVLYLSDVAKGGHILFPKTKVKGESWPNCRNPKEILRPAKGNAIFLFSLHPDASTDPRIPHARCHISEGKLQYALKFFRSPELDETTPWIWCFGVGLPGVCQKKTVYMVGTPDYYDACRKSCNAC